MLKLVYQDQAEKQSRKASLEQSGRGPAGHSAVSHRALARPLSRPRPRARPALSSRPARACVRACRPARARARSRARAGVCVCVCVCVFPPSEVHIGARANASTPRMRQESLQRHCGSLFQPPHLRKLSCLSLV